MKVLVDKARDRGHEYYFRVIIYSDLPEEEQVVEEFTYGKDMSLAQIRKEFLAKLKNQYEEPTEETLDFEGNEYEV